MRVRVDSISKVYPAPRRLMVGLATLSLLGLASTWGPQALEAWLAPWEEEGRG